MVKYLGVRCIVIVIAKSLDLCKVYIYIYMYIRLIDRLKFSRRKQIMARNHFPA